MAFFSDDFFFEYGKSCFKVGSTFYMYVALFGRLESYYGIHFWLLQGHHYCVVRVLQWIRTPLHTVNWVSFTFFTNTQFLLRSLLLTYSNSNSTWLPFVLSNDCKITRWRNVLQSLTLNQKHCHAALFAVYNGTSFVAEVLQKTLHSDTLKRWASPKLLRRNSSLLRWIA